MQFTLVQSAGLTIMTTASCLGSLLLFRHEFDQYINLRPARLMPGIIAP
jgi:isocitrate/isopropylmalate dehydrogenase